MKRIPATIIRRLFLWTNVPLAIALICSAYLRYTDPGTFWPAGFASLAFPFLWIINLGFFIIWLFFRKFNRYWLFSLVAILVCMPAVTLAWGVHLFSNDQPVSEKSFSIVTFNCSSMGMKGYKDQRDIRESIYEELCDMQPDILCLQEFYSNDDPRKSNHLDSICTRLKYPYTYFVKRHTQWNTWHFGTVLFSRFPIIDTAMTDLGGGWEADDLISAKLLVHGDTVHILSVHLASYQLHNSDYNVVKASGARKIKSVMGKMRSSFGLRAEQARLVRQKVDESKDPVIVCGDLNDVPLSYTYQTIRGNNLQDAFLKKGFGFGRTFASLSHTLRIDYILPGPHFSVEHFAIRRRQGFEHFPVMARLSLRD